MRRHGFSTPLFLPFTFYDRTNMKNNQTSTYGGTILHYAL